MAAHAGRAVAFDVLRRRGAERLAQRKVGRRDMQRMEVREALEHRAHGVAGAVGDLHRRRHVRGFAQEKQEGLDDQLARALGAEAAAVDADGLAGDRQRGDSGRGTDVGRSEAKPRFDKSIHVMAR